MGAKVTFSRSGPYLVAHVVTSQSAEGVKDSFASLARRIRNRLIDPINGGFDMHIWVRDDADQIEVEGQVREIAARLAG